MKPASFILREHETNAVVTMADGSAFHYSTEELAEIGRRVLSKLRKVRLYITDAP